MAITALTLTNPGAETGDTTGWTLRSGAALQAVTSHSTITPYSGSYFFAHTGIAATASWDQEIDVSAHAAAIDAGTAAVKATGYHNTIDGATGALYIEFYATDGSTLLGGTSGSETSPASWTLKTLYCALPTGTRYVRIGSNHTRVGSNNIFTYWDDYALEISNDKGADYPDEDFAPFISQSVAYGLVSAPAEQARSLQTPVLVTGAAETSSGEYEVYTHQVVGYALVKQYGDRRELRAFTFTQDDHTFYGVQLGAAGTLITDKLAGQWSAWKSDGFNYWRVNDVVYWEGYNLGCDTESGKIWEINPEGRLDEGTTAISSTVTGQVTVRMRQAVPCFMAELSVSDADPATTGRTITLRTSDDTGDSYIDHGSVAGAASGTRTLFRWYGLGLMNAPGRIFEIVDTGYARRIDALNIEIGADPEAVR